MRAALLALTLGCAGGGAHQGLPDGVVATVALESGAVATVYVELRRDRSGPRVRVAEERLDLATFGEPAALEPDGSAHHRGPGAGFHLRRVEDRLELLRPRGDEARWSPVLRGVDRVLGAVWVNTAQLTEGERHVLDLRLKEIVPLDVRPGEATVDGDLSEWEGAAARPVERPSQVLAGVESWSGPRDAAFGTAARWREGELVLALRIRDDIRVRGADQLEILAGDRVLRLPLPERAAVVEGPGWRAAFAEPDWLGQGVELALSAPELSAVLARPPVVQLVDQDPGEEAVRLGSAASAELGGLAAAR